MQLTKLEQIAAMCLQGLLAGNINIGTSTEMADSAISLASALLANIPAEETRRRVLVKTFNYEGSKRVDICYEAWFIQFAQYSNQDNEAGLLAYVEMDDGSVVNCDAEDIKFKDCKSAA